MDDGIGYSKKNYYMFKDSLHSDCIRNKNRPSWIKENIQKIIKEKKSVPWMSEISEGEYPGDV